MTSEAHSPRSQGNANAGTGRDTVAEGKRTSDALSPGRRFTMCDVVMPVERVAAAAAT